MGAIFEVFAQAAPELTGVTTMTTTITGVDGNDIALYISHPDDIDGALPGVVHLHGGGMAISSAADTGYVRATRIPRCDRSCRRRRGIPQLRRQARPAPVSPRG